MTESSTSIQNSIHSPLVDKAKNEPLSSDVSKKVINSAIDYNQVTTK